MTRMDKLQLCLERTMGPQNGPPTPTAHMMADLYMDSLDKVEFVMNVEQEFGIEVPDNVAEKWQNWGQVMAYVQNLPEKVEVPRAD